MPRNRAPQPIPKRCHPDTRTELMQKTASNYRANSKGTLALMTDAFVSHIIRTRFATRSSSYAVVFSFCCHFWFLEVSRGEAQSFASLPLLLWQLSHSQLHFPFGTTRRESATNSIISRDHEESILNGNLSLVEHNSRLGRRGEVENSEKWRVEKPWQ